MQMILRTALLLVLIAPGSAFADASDPSPSCTAATVFQVSQGSAVTAHSGGYYAARQMSFSVTPESWSTRGLGVTAAALDVSGAMAWGVGPKWYRRLADSNDFSASVFAQVLVGSMDTAVTLPQQTKGRFVQPGVGATVGFKNYSVGLEADYADAPVLAAGIQNRSGAVRGRRVLLTLGYGFKHYTPDTGPCATPEVRAAHVAAEEQQRQQQAATQARLELGVGFNGPQHPYAEFPGIALSAVQTMPRSSKWGIAIVEDFDSSYVRKTWGVGARVYARSEGLQDGRFGVTSYVQVLGGASAGGRSGIINSTGGTTVQPGAGLVFGGGQRAFFVQYDYRFVRGGVILDDHMPGFTRSMSGKRVSFGYVLRFDRR